MREALLAAAGGIVGVGQASVGMAAPHGLMTVFNSIRDGYLAHLALADATARAAALRERGPFKPAQVEPFKAGPDDIMVFAVTTVGRWDTLRGTVPCHGCSGVRA